MPIIHITIDDDSQALTVVATCLNLGLDVRIDLDEMSDDAIVEDVATLAQRAWENATALSQQNQQSWDEIAARDVATRKQEAYDARYAEAIFAVDHAKCTSCRTPKGSPCVQPSGKPYRSFVHIDRIVAARKAVK